MGLRWCLEKDEQEARDISVQTKLMVQGALMKLNWIRLSQKPYGKPLTVGRRQARVRKRGDGCLLYHKVERSLSVVGVWRQGSVAGGWAGCGWWEGTMRVVYVDSQAYLRCTYVGESACVQAHEWVQTRWARRLAESWCDVSAGLGPWLAAARTPIDG
jgi:hypothetical protein